MPAEALRKLRAPVGVAQLLQFDQEIGQLIDVVGLRLQHGGFAVEPFIQRAILIAIIRERSRRQCDAVLRQK